MVVEENKQADDGSVENQSKKAAKKLAKDAAKAAKVTISKREFNVCLHLRIIVM